MVLATFVQPTHGFKVESVHSIFDRAPMRHPVARAKRRGSISQAQEGEATENDILARLLKVTAAKASKSGKGSVGYRDPRYGVEFAEGFEIFRTYLGKDYRAKATAGYWMLMHTGDLYPSLNELSRAIGAKAENAWVNWFYIDPNGDRAQVSTLRNHAKIIRRKRFA